VFALSLQMTFLFIKTALVEGILCVRLILIIRE
jgi:hypothetical protein